jgi:myosin-5
LLEKSRVVNLAPEERNYHIFYVVLKGFQKLEEIGLSANSQYEYLKSSNGGYNFNADNVDDLEFFEEIQNTFT